MFTKGLRLVGRSAQARPLFVVVVMGAVSTATLLLVLAISFTPFVKTTFIYIYS